MKSALIIGASGGIGAAVADQLEADRVDVTRLSRSVDGFDVSNPATVARCLDRLDGPFDLIFISIGILAPLTGRPEKSLSALKHDDMARVFQVNTIGPALVLSHAARLIPKDRRAVVATLSARVGSIGDNQIGGWYSYRASKAALNQIVHGAAIELGRSHKESLCVALHPGTVATPFTAEYAGRHKTVPPQEAAENLLRVIKALKPEHTGGFYDYAAKEIPW
ncbi:SDR family NAD(P)-dependent oxidoreductase [Yoonia sediminilitoris]|uniref:NAD(P)-dependent dehydrogenase (Short-subunit alcohol dehydrogenase family) n=1 Tax=Yoonia sediminilitoris TaxID=1286148 RepID=A0A2T6KKF2_9RHOB|nr:SDR family NAD(P)-dependent oxidoreductase [Yoonia sediminilitoris]PUB16415.1 NAD(P)-dependent dehydrogenase (short-subunit alcohol dehydrogenase family) [Yoonia sediminilitoris]RCW96764.1 NAD(P)-dependent dehydrogenase (short-subunit alcohol dehydrogenase family) [Yoonia sediminilitoris]